jgi:hypothetical protein
VYAFDGSNVVRRLGNDPPETLRMPRVKASRFVRDADAHVTAWRWELELSPGPQPARVPPLFTFTAVPRQPTEL